jgi:hypothetical protein
VRARWWKPTLLFLAFVAGLVTGCGSPTSVETPSADRAAADVTVLTEVIMMEESLPTPTKSPPSITPSPSPKPSPTVILATSMEEIVGVWRGIKAHAVFQRFDEDGSCHVANTLETLDTPPNVECVYHFEGDHLYLEVVKNNEFPPCSEPLSVYQVQLLGDDMLLFKKVDDSCIPRARSMLQDHERVPTG